MNICYILLATLIPFQGFTQPAPDQPNQATCLPSTLIDGRFYLKIPAINGDTILAFCDTGGGYTAIYSATIKKLNLESKLREVEIKGEKITYIFAKEVIAGSDIPGPAIGSYYKSAIELPFFEVDTADDQTDIFLKYVAHDAFLGQFFFIDHAWTFDYGTGKIFINTPLSTHAMGGNIQTLGFKKDKAGNKKFGHPSLKIAVDGQVLDMLFDTGASFLLSNHGKNELGVDKKSVGGSFIAKSVFDKWHQKHPDWRIIEKGEITGADLIEVPEVKVGNLTAGPVWFAKRPDEAWSKGMKGSMDKIVKGAIGGSFLTYFKIVVDYQTELIKFEIKH